MNEWLDFRRPRGGVTFIAVLFAFAGAVLPFVGETWFERYVCPIFVPLGIGLWLKHSWARWTMFTLLVVSMLIALLLLCLQGFSGRIVVRMLVSASMLYSLWDWDVYPEDDSKITLAPADD
ncbi:hypothetical protein [Blastopirellula marina]|uniref:Uncharacterized protein n=1 Tax=Blastopirellula marina TaxID=124 RepID=A0A2S8F2C1_9BACT|nr:hypothetical protein [Blastopirellula marina]PQO26247.1 hypothetical protein C5Y98_30840 [Blastopirellula marina]PTL40646.1 hypothetical protein C5Y97_30855 [Blastopirellula marina]